VVFDALRAAGGMLERIGVPIEPGMAGWVGRLGNLSVFGLASCELFGGPGAFDVLLPRLLPGEHPDAAMLARLAKGGLLLDGPSIIPDYTPTRVRLCSDQRANRSDTASSVHTAFMTISRRVRA
jgi:hypothetical protein